MGYPVLQWIYGDDLNEEKRYEEAVQWYKQAAEGGQLECWFNVGYAYETGEGAPQDIAYAVQCYNKGLTQKKDTGKRVGCANRLGVMYFEGKGVETDYGKAVQLLTYGYEHNSKFGLFYLGKSYFRGLGAPQDYIKARTFLEQMDWNNREAFYMLGVIYGQGLGVMEDIKKGVEYLQKAGDLPEAKEERLKYKKTLFGKWIRR